MKKQYFLAHRGYQYIAPENTYEAFWEAYKNNFDGVELDVHLTKDNKIVIIHDENTLRTSNIKKNIIDSTLEELKKLNFNYKFHNIKKQEILTLEEFLNIFYDKFEIINIELKTDVVDYPKIEKKLIKLLNKLNQDKYSKIILSSFNFETLIKLKKLDGNLKLSFLFNSIKKLKKIKNESLQKVVQYLAPSYEIYQKNYQYIQNKKMPLFLWTCKSKTRYKKFLKDQDVMFQISNNYFKNKN